MVTLARIHMTNPSEMDSSLKTWTQDIYPLRQRFGMPVVGAWINTHRNLFFWLVSYEGTREEYEATHREYGVTPIRTNTEYTAFTAKREDVWLTPVVPLASRNGTGESPRTEQLRIYTISPRHMDDFLKPWQEQVQPLRERYGFRTEGAWVSDERNQLYSYDRNHFFWIMSYDGTPEEFEAMDKEYFAAPERAAINPDTRPFIAKSEIYFITSVMPEM